MDAAVPFALVAAVQLLALAAALGLAAAGGAAAYRRGARTALVAGALLLAAAHGLTGALLGGTDGDGFALARAAAYLLIGLGAGGLATAPLPNAVVVPVGAAAGPAGLAAVAAAAAAALTVRARRAGRVLLTVALVLTAGSELLAPAARHSAAAAVALLALRGVASVAMLAFVARLVEHSLLAKVVAAILASVLALGLGTALIVGSVATGSLNRDSERRLAEVARGQVEILKDEKQNSLQFAQVLAGCRDETAACAQQLGVTAARPTLRGVVCGLANPRCKPYAGLVESSAGDSVATTAIRRNAAVREVLAARGRHPVATLDVVLGRRPTLVALGVAPVFGGEAGPRRPDGAALYATVVDDTYVRGIGLATGLDATLYVADRRVASTLSATTLIDAELRRHGVVETLTLPPATDADDGVSVAAEGRRPGVRYQAIRSEDGELAGVLALSADSNVILATQRRVLSSLFLGTVAIALLVGLLAVALGRRIVRPVTELTLAASRVRRGDLDVRTELRTNDELGVLSRTFDAMTSSLAASNESLRQAAEDEAALRGRLETVLDSMGDGLVTTDAGDRVVAVNRVALDLLAAEEADVAGLAVADVLAGTTASGEPLLPALDGGRLERVGVLQRADGGFVPVALAATPLRGAEGHVVVVRDMTREHEVERMKTEFLSNVSHELRTPLTPIRGYAEILHRRPDLPAEKTALYASSILESSVRMSRVVDLLVDVAALEAGRVEPHVAAVRPATFVDERLAAWRKREPGREFRRRVAAGLPDMLADPAWVAKALDELVDNAVKYSGKPVTIGASLGPDGRHVRLTVRDLGAGIPEERRATLFTPFEQVDGSATRSVGGLGLGLSFVRRVADDFGLDVVVESTLGKGSAFSLEVPAAAAPPRPARRPRTTSRPKGRAR
ncbi:MAG TPA: ATP-binding protein [Mycobacteriales bacterium]|jgi:PAS domain S-box-containing protein|nr:ATP-binding protein [Mycobacteriales bacterium]